MILFQGSVEYKKSFQLKAHQGSVVCLGNFDGYHLGHQALLEEARKVSKSLGIVWGVLSFDPHPIQVLAPQFYKGLVMGRKDQAHFLEKLGTDFFVLEPFDLNLSQWSADEFIEEILIRRLKVKHVIVGFNFHFGKDKMGRAEYLKQKGESLGFGVSIIQPIEIELDGNKKTISTTLLREFLAKGELDRARAILGRPFSISGEVIKGHQRGRLLGFPTANVISESTAALPLGVYFSRTHLPQGTHWSITNIGKSPTFENANLKVTSETHIFDFVGDIYGEVIEVELLGYIRPERKFGTKEELVSQIQSDTEAVKKMRGNFSE